MPFSWLADVEEDAYATQQEAISLTPLGSTPGTAPRSSRRKVGPAIVWFWSISASALLRL